MGDPALAVLCACAFVALSASIYKAWVHPRTHKHTHITQLHLSQHTEVIYLHSTRMGGRTHARTHTHTHTHTGHRSNRRGPPKPACPWGPGLGLSNPQKGGGLRPRHCGRRRRWTPRRGRSRGARRRGLRLCRRRDGDGWGRGGGGRPAVRPWAHPVAGGLGGLVKKGFQCLECNPREGQPAG
jgi:hypothetical protein